MQRSATSYPDEWVPLIEQRVTAQGRSESNYIARLIEADLRAAGLLEPEKDSTEAEIGEALKEAQSAGVDVVATLRRASRRKEKVAA